MSGSPCSISSTERPYLERRLDLRLELEICNQFAITPHNAQIMKCVRSGKDPRDLKDEFTDRRQLFVRISFSPLRHSCEHKKTKTKRYKL